LPPIRNPAHERCSGAKVIGRIAANLPPEGRIDGRIKPVPNREINVRSSADALAVTPDGTGVVVGCRDGSVHLWNLSEDRVSILVSARDRPYNPVEAVAVHQDGDQVVVVTRDQTILVLGLDGVRQLESFSVRQSGSTYGGNYRRLQSGDRWH
jgi:WD40 repeat protein